MKNAEHHATVLRLILNILAPDVDATISAHQMEWEGEATFSHSATELALFRTYATVVQALAALDNEIDHA